MGIQIVSLFPETETEQETEVSVEDIETHLLSGGETELDELPLEDMLCHFGHEALGLSKREALEIDPHYRRRLENPI